MSQSSFIAAALIAGFVLFLAARNRLSTYAGVLWGATTAPVPTPSVAQAAEGTLAASGATLGPIGAIGQGLLQLFGVGGAGAAGASGAAAASSSAPAVLSTAALIAA